MRSTRRAEPVPGDVSVAADAVPPPPADAAEREVDDGAAAEPGAAKDLAGPGAGAGGDSGADDPAVDDVEVDDGNDLDDDERDDDPDDETPEMVAARPATRTRSLPRGMLAAFLAAAVLLLAGAGFQLRAAQLRGAASVRNRALVDTTATTQVVGDVTDALNAVFSYRYDDTSATAQAARRLLTGTAARQWRQLFSVVQKQATKQHLSVTTNVVLAGVTRLTPDRATVLVFIDQTTKKGTGGRSAAAAQLRISAQHQGDRWIISGIEAR